MDMEELKNIVEDKKESVFDSIENPLENVPQETIIEPPQIVTEVAEQPHQSMTERAKDYVGVLAIQKAVEDEELVKDVTELKKDELMSMASADNKKEKAKEKDADTEYQRAVYGANEGTASYAGIKKPLPQKMQAVLFFILSIIQCIVLVVVGSVASVVNIVADCVNSVVTRIADLSVVSRKIIITAIIVGGAYLGYVILKTILANYGVII